MTCLVIRALQGIDVVIALDRGREGGGRDRGTESVRHWMDDRITRKEPGWTGVREGEWGGQRKLPPVRS